MIFGEKYVFYYEKQLIYGYFQRFSHKLRYFVLIFYFPGNLPDKLWGAQAPKIAKMKQFLKGNI